MSWDRLGRIAKEALRENMNLNKLDRMLAEALMGNMEEIKTASFWEALVMFIALPGIGAWALARLFTRLVRLLTRLALQPLDHGRHRHRERTAVQGTGGPYGGAESVGQPAHGPRRGRPCGQLLARPRDGADHHRLTRRRAFRARRRRDVRVRRGRRGVAASTPSVGTVYFKRALEQLGWAEGRTVRFETRYGEYEPDRTAVMARELVALKPDVFYTSSDGPVRAATQATTSIPIVVGAVADLVALGGVQSLARPGGNVTGVNHAQHGLDRKRLEILKEAVPSVPRIAYLFDPRAIPETALRALDESASQLKVQLQRVGVNKPDQGSNASSTRPRIASSQVSRATSTSSTARASG